MVYIKVRKIPKHECSLPKEDELITLYINGGFLVDFRRKFRQFCMVSSESPESRDVLRSTAEIRFEERRHLRKFYYMIHPFSDLRMFWETIMIVVYGSLFILMPVELGTPVTPILVLYAKFFFDILSFVDIILFFFTGYFDVKNHKTIMKPKQVFKHYLFPFFFFDLLSSLPYNMYIVKEDKHELDRMKHFFLLKLTRVPTFNRYVEKFLIRGHLWTYMMKNMTVIVWVLILTWWSTAYGFLVESFVQGMDDNQSQGDPDVFNAMVKSFYHVTKSFMLLKGIVNEQCIETEIILFHGICIIIGCVITMVMLAQVMQIYKRYSSSTNKYNSLIQEIDEYMRYKELPPSLRNKVFRYVDFKFQKNIYNETFLMKTLSKILKQDIMVHNCRRLVQKVNVFKDLPLYLIERIATKLRPEIYLPNDLIVEAGTPGNAMYFVYMGTVSVYAINGKEFCHLEEGSYFGEISLVVNEYRVASVIAVTECEVLKLSRRDFLDIIEPHPRLYTTIRDSALERLKAVEKLAPEHKLN